MELKEIRRKIESVNNIWKLTSALETLSALKMKKAQKIALSSKPFAEKIKELLAKLEPFLEEQRTIFFQEKKADKVLVAAVSSDRGFCGSFNQNIFRLSEREIKKQDEGVETRIFPIGKKGIQFFSARGRKINSSFSGIGDWAELGEIKPVSDFLVKGFLENKFQKIILVYTRFISTLSQKPEAVQLLPLSKESLREFLGVGETAAAKGGEPRIENFRREFLIEPSSEVLAQEIVPQLIEYLLYQYILDSNASEHSARMMAMRNASDNAKKKNDELKLDYNKARQEDITSEVLEVSSAKEALE